MSTIGSTPAQSKAFVEEMKRRARRQFLGALALLFLSLTVLPVLFEKRTSDRSSGIQMRWETTAAAEAEQEAPSARSETSTAQQPITPAPAAVIERDTKRDTTPDTKPSAAAPVRRVPTQLASAAVVNVPSPRKRVHEAASQEDIAAAQLQKKRREKALARAKALKQQRESTVQDRYFAAAERAQSSDFHDDEAAESPKAAKKKRTTAALLATEDDPPHYRRALSDRDIARRKRLAYEEEVSRSSNRRDEDLPAPHARKNQDMDRSPVYRKKGVADAAETIRRKKALATLEEDTPRYKKIAIDDSTDQPRKIHLNEDGSPHKKPRDNLIKKKTSLESYALHLPMLNSEDKAAELKTHLSDMGLRAHVVRVNTSQGSTAYRVRLAPFGSKESADKALRSLRIQGYSAALVGSSGVRRPKEPVKNRSQTED